MTFTSHSQPETAQDVAVASFYHHQRGGYFVDVGAYDGKHFSNTYALEHDLGWSGVCIEPLDHAFAGCRAHRKVPCFNVAAYSNDGEVEFAKSDVLSGIGRHIDRWKGETEHAPRVMMKCRRLTSILGEVGAPSVIEYLSIDTEGSELEVLYGIDFSLYSFGYITIEHNEIEPRRGQMRTFLEARGYKHLRKNLFDDDYVRAT